MIKPIKLNIHPELKKTCVLQQMLWDTLSAQSDYSYRWKIMEVLQCTSRNVQIISVMPVYSADQKLIWSLQPLSTLKSRIPDRWIKHNYNCEWGPHHITPGAIGNRSRSKMHVSLPAQLKPQNSSPFAVALGLDQVNTQKIPFVHYVHLPKLL